MSTRRRNNRSETSNSAPEILAALAIFAAIALPSPTAARTAGQLPPLPCDLTHDATHTVASVKDARTIILDDGTPVRLSGILTHEKSSPAPLKSLLIGRPITLAFVDPKHDRYGNLQAHVFIQSKNQWETSTGSPNSPLTWVQADILKSGHARAYEPNGQSKCLSLLISHQRHAQQNNLGLWALPPFQPQPATNIATLLNRRGEFLSVQGQIHSIAHRSKFTYLNFSSNWRTDFTIAIPRQLIREHPQWAKALNDLKGIPVEVQGWIISRNGPYIELEHPAHLQVLKNHKQPATNAGTDSR